MPATMKLYQNLERLASWCKAVCHLAQHIVYIHNKVVMFSAWSFWKYSMLKCPLILRCYRLQLISLQ